ncbi:MAG: CopD family protein [Gemmatimonadaceae bacterium]|nr:CopD family protein [Gemmatimonadaceae bacterium]
MSGYYYTLVTIHVLAALVWLGGMFFLGLVGAPVLRRVEPPVLRQQLFNELGVRFRTVGWIAIAALATTGTLMLRVRGLLHWEGVLGDPDFWATTAGTALGVKLAAVLFMLTVSFVHDFIHGPAASRAIPGSRAAAAMRRRASVLARVNALVGLVLLLAAVRLARG